MLINCPRCGFSQPQDQYCAQCGVDMQAYKPKEVPAWQRLIQSAVFQIGVLVILAALVGQSIWRSHKPQSWVQKSAAIPAVRKLSDSPSSEPEEDASVQKGESTSSSQAQELNNIQGRELRLNRTAAAAAGSAAPQTSAAASENTSDTLATTDNTPQGQVVFHLIYAEVPLDVLNKWVAESSGLGLYQTLTDYSAGILYDFSKHKSENFQTLKTADLRLAPGNNNTSISGTMTDDGSQVLGLVTGIDFRSNENDTVHGSISVSKNTRTGNEVYPAEFDLPRGAVFFIVGALKRDNFPNDRPKLNMPPFQIFRSPDFMTRKTEFVIILEPNYK